MEVTSVSLKKQIIQDCCQVMQRLKDIPDVTNLIFTRKMGDAKVDFVMNFGVVWVVPEHKFCRLFFHDLKQCLRGVSKPDSQYGPFIQPVVITQFQATPICYRYNKIINQIKSRGRPGVHERRYVLWAKVKQKPKNWSRPFTRLATSIKEIMNWTWCRKSHE